VGVKDILCLSEVNEENAGSNPKALPELFLAF
jgi:hypothetical protein